MASLMDRINKGLTQPTPMQDPDQRGIEKVLRAKGGKAGTGAGAPMASGLVAETAKQQAQDELRAGQLRGTLAATELRTKEQAIAEQDKLSAERLASRGRMAREQMQVESTISASQRRAREDEARSRRSAEENMKLDAMQAQATQRLRDLATQREVTLENIFGDFERSNKELELRKDQSELEQLGFDLAMSDRAYVDELNRVGRERLLSNDLTFSEESARITLGDQLESTLQQLEWATAFNGDRRNWQEKLGQMDIDSALAIYEAQVEGANQRMMYEGAGELLSAGFKYGASEGAFGDRMQSGYRSTYGKKD